MITLAIKDDLEILAQLFTLILVFIFVLGLTYFTTKYVGNYQKTKLTGSNIQVKETFRISNSKYLQIVKIGDKYFAIAVCKDTITYLGELDEESLIFKDNSGEFKSETFKMILDKFKKDKPVD